MIKQNCFVCHLCEITLWLKGAGPNNHYPSSGPQAPEEGTDDHRLVHQRIVGGAAFQGGVSNYYLASRRPPRPSVGQPARSPFSARNPLTDLHEFTGAFFPVFVCCGGWAKNSKPKHHHVGDCFRFERRTATWSAAAIMWSSFGRKDLVENTRQGGGIEPKIIHNRNQ